MQLSERQVRELIGKNLPKIAAGVFNAMYNTVGFKATEEPARDYSVDGQVVTSQLLYSRNYQVHSFLLADVGEILKLGQRAFPKCGRVEGSKMAISANGEALNTITAKLASVVGKVDEDQIANTSPPLVLNCTGPNSIAVSGQDCLFLKLASPDLTMLVIVSVQRI